MKVNCSKELQEELEKAYGMSSDDFNKAIENALVDAMMKEKGMGKSAALKHVRELMKDKSE